MRLATLLLCLISAVLPACAAASEHGVRPVTPGADGRSVADLERRGRDAAVHGDGVRAEQYLSLALDHGAPPQRVLPLLLRACFSSSHLRAALNYAEPYLRDHPEDERLRYLVATVHLGLGQREEARAQLEQLIQLNGESADGLYLLAVVEFEHDAESAREHLRKYLDVAPRGSHAAEVRGRLAELALRSKQSERRGAAADPEPSQQGESWIELDSTPRPELAP